jgi:signal transduction histidine kinase/FixJ family two-component response regulator
MLTPTSPPAQFGLYIIAAVITGFCSLLLFAAGRRSRGMDPLTWWATSIALTGGSLLAAATPRFIPQIPCFVGSDVAVGLMLLGGGVSLLAARTFAGRPLLPTLAVAGAVLWLLTLLVTGFDGAVGAHMALAWGLSALYAAAIVAALWPDGREALPSRPFFLLLTALYGASYLVRAVLSGLGLEQALQNAPATATVLEAQLRVIGIAFLALALTKERAELAIARSRDLARDAGEARKRFLAQMSHEVRTPLNGVLGLAQVLLQDSRLVPDQRQHVATLEAAGRHLLAIVNDALDLAKIDAGHLAFRIRPFDPSEAMSACLALVRPAAEDKRIKLQLLLAAALPGTISGDTTRLQQILLNLLWNALKFTPDGGAVTLRVGAGVDWLRCEVIDTGPGIPADKQVMLFQDFARLDPNAADGTGLGLAISARLAERMGGRLVFHPGPGGVGSLFRLELPWPAIEGPREAEQEEPYREPVELPLVPEPVRAAPLPPPVAAPIPAPLPASVASPASPPIQPPIPSRTPESVPERVEMAPPPVQARAGGLHLLVVDDVAANRAMMRALLTSDGHLVTAAENGAEAVALTARDRFDAVLMDVRMPVMDGIEATRRIRMLPGEAGATPIIAISADVMPETTRTCLAAGMNAMLAKPIERDALVATLRRLELQRYQPVARERAPAVPHTIERWALGRG